MHLIKNSTDDIAVFRELVMGYYVESAVVGSGGRPAMLIVCLAMGKDLPFEYAESDETMKPLVDRLKSLLVEVAR